jgi:hypothetical protein
VGENLGVAMIMHEDNDEASKRRLPAGHLLGLVATEVLKPSGIELLTHEDCHIERNAADIRRTIVDDRDRVYRQVQKSRPEGMSRERFSQIANAFSRLKLEEEHIASEEMDKGGVVRLTERAYESCHPIRRTSLVNKPHMAKDLLFNYGSGRVFKTEDAFYEQAPAYHASIGDLPELAVPLQEAELGFVFDEQDFVDAGCVLNAAASLFLPHAEDEPLGIHITY